MGQNWPLTFLCLVFVSLSLVGIPPFGGFVSKWAISLAALDGLGGPLAYLIPAVLGHHERWDGRGYPDGLAGDDIPISAQIVSMADVYGALVSKRVYKAAYSPDTAVQMILHGDCGQFNPLLLECLVDIQDVLKAEIVERENEEG